MDQQSRVEQFNNPYHNNKIVSKFLSFELYVIQLL